MVLKRIEHNPVYKGLLEEALMSVAKAQGFSASGTPGFYRFQGFLFVSSPGSTTPFISTARTISSSRCNGEKQFSIYDNDDRKIANEDAIELRDHKHRNSSTTTSFEPKAMHNQLKPGDGCVRALSLAASWCQDFRHLLDSVAITWKTQGGEPPQRHLPVIPCCATVASRRPRRARPLADEFKLGIYRVIKMWSTRSASPKASGAGFVVSCAARTPTTITTPTRPRRPSRPDRPQGTSMTRLDLRGADALAGPATADERLMLFDAKTEGEDVALRYEVFDTLAAEPSGGAGAARLSSPPTAVRMGCGPARSARSNTARPIWSRSDRTVGLLPIVTIPLLLRTVRMVVGPEWRLDGQRSGLCQKLDPPMLGRLLADIARLTRAGSACFAQHARGGTAWPIRAGTALSRARPFLPGVARYEHLKPIVSQYRRGRDASKNHRAFGSCVPGQQGIERASGFLLSAHPFREMGVDNILAEDWCRLLQDAARAASETMAVWRCKPSMRRPIIALPRQILPDQYSHTSLDTAAGRQIAVWASCCSSGEE